jgi:hypothetical protein
VQVDDIDFLRHSPARSPACVVTTPASNAPDGTTPWVTNLLAAATRPIRCDGVTFARTPVELIEATVRINPKKNSLTPSTSNGNPATPARGIAANASGERQPASTFVRTSPTALRIRIAINDPTIPPVDPTDTTWA